MPETSSTMKRASENGSAHAATVIRRGTETITIQLDRPVGQYVDGCIRCSPLAVEKIGT